MADGGDDWIENVSTALDRLADPGADRAQYLLRHGTMRVGIYAPREDDQEPHRQDELYIVLSGTAQLSRGAERRSVSPGDVVFVPAGMEHRFHLPSPDFATWVVFWGREGGESR